MKIKRKTLNLFITWCIRLLIIFSIFTVLYIYTQTQFFVIKDYKVYGLDDKRKEMIIEKLKIYDDGIVSILFSNKIFTYNDDKLISLIFENINDVSEIKNQPIGLHTIRVDISLHKPLFRVFEKEALSDKGVIFKPYEDVSSLPYLEIASSSFEEKMENNINIKHLLINKEVVDFSFLNKLSSFTSDVSKIIFNVDNIKITESGDVILYSSHNFSKLMFKKDSDLKKVWTTLISAIDTEPLKTKMENEKDMLEYLDVRFGNKVFYKFNQEGLKNRKITDIISDYESSTTTNQNTEERNAQ